MRRKKVNRNELQLDKKTECPTCHTKVGEPGCTREHKKDYSKEKVKNRPWRYDMHGKIRRFSGVKSDYSCSKCSKTFYDEFKGYKKKEIRPYLNIRTLGLIEKIQSSYEMGPIEDAQKYVKQLKKTRLYTSDATIKKCIDLIDKGLHIKPRPELTRKQNIFWLIGQVIPHISALYIFLYLWYPFEMRLLRNTAVLGAKYPELKDNFILDDFRKQSEMKGTISFEFEKQVLLRESSSEENLKRIDRLLKMKPNDFLLGALKLETLADLNKKELLFEEIEKLKSKKKIQPFGWFFYKALLPYMNEKNVEIEFIKESGIVLINRKKKIDLMPIIETLVTSIYHGEKIRQSLLLIEGVCLDHKQYPFLGSLFSEILDRLPKIIPRVGEFEITFMARRLSTKFNVLKEGDFLTNIYVEDMIDILRQGLLRNSLNHFLMYKKAYWNWRLFRGKAVSAEEVIPGNIIVSDLILNIAGNENKPELYVLMITSYVIGQYDGVLDFYNNYINAERMEYIKKEQDINWNYFMIGHSLLTKNKNKEALDAFKKIKRFDENLLEFAKAVAYINDGKKKKAVTKLHELAEKGIRERDKLLYARARAWLRLKYIFDEKPEIKDEEKFIELEQDDSLKYKFKLNPRDKKQVSQERRNAGIRHFKDTQNYKRLWTLDEYLFVDLHQRLASLVVGSDVGVFYIDKATYFLTKEMMESKSDKIEEIAMDLINHIEDKDIRVNLYIAAALTIKHKWRNPRLSFKLMWDGLKRYPKNKLLKRGWREIKSYCKEKKLNKEKWYLEYQEKIKSLNVSKKDQA